MKHLKTPALAALAVMGLMAFLGAGTASATQLEKYTTPSANDPLSATAHIEATLKAGTSTVLTNTEGSFIVTCTTSTMTGSLTENAPDPHGTISTLDFGSASTPCAETTDVLANGSLTIEHIANTTNGTVTSIGAEIKVASTILGINCTFKTGTGTSIGELTGAKSSTEHATLHIHGVIPGGLCGDGIWEGTYLVTDPTGLTIETATQIPTQLEKYTTPSANDPLSATAHIEATLKAGTSAILENTEGSFTDTCTTSTVTGNLTENSPDPHGTNSTLDFGSVSTPCAETTDVLNAGSLTIEHIATTTNGTVKSLGAEVKVASTILGINCTFKTGVGTSIGELTGAKSSTEHATIHIHGAIPGGLCGDGVWTATYLVTDPTGLTVE